MIAHRGDWLEGDHPGAQNSVRAVLSALDAGADGAEVDARLSADGTVVLHHDAEIGLADLGAGCDAPEGTPVFALGDPALIHLATLAELLGRLAELLATPPGLLATPPEPGGQPGAGGRHRPFLLNIELKDLPGEPGWDGRHVLAARVAELLYAGLAAGPQFDRAVGPLHRGRHRPWRRRAGLPPGDIGQFGPPQASAGSQEGQRLEDIGLAGAVGTGEHHRTRIGLEPQEGIATKVAEGQADHRRRGLSFAFGHTAVRYTRIGIRT